MILYIIAGCLYFFSISRVEDLHQFLFHNHPSNDSANYMPVERSILDDGCVEIINVHGSYSDVS